MTLESIPTPETLRALMGDAAFAAWNAVLEFIDGNYRSMASSWNSGGKAGKYELKFRRGGKTLCALYPREGAFGFMVIYGKAEREEFEARKDAREEDFPAEICLSYDRARTYHDGKWIMIDVDGTGRLAGIAQMLTIKRKPDRGGGRG